MEVSGLPARRLAGAWLFGWLLASVGAAHAQPAQEPPALGQLQQMVDDLGYSTTLDAGAQYFSFTMPGSMNFSVNVMMASNGSYASVYCKLFSVAASQLEKTNLSTLLGDDGSNDFYFSLNDEGNGQESLIANAIIPASGSSLEIFNTELQRFKALMQGTMNDWTNDIPPGQ
jgi:hypothetical protein